MPFSRLRKGAFCIILNPRLNEKPGTVHLYWQLMACGDSHSSDEKSPVNQRVAPICGKNGCVFQFLQKTHAETDLPQG